MNENEFGDVCVKVSSLPDPSPELKEEVRTAFDVAIANITKFHSMQKMEDMMTVETMEGVRCDTVTSNIVYIMSLSHRVDMVVVIPYWKKYIYM